MKCTCDAHWVITIKTENQVKSGITLGPHFRMDLHFCRAASASTGHQLPGQVTQGSPGPLLP